jgi:type I restriction enzyme S subunit
LALDIHFSPSRPYSTISSLFNKIRVLEDESRRLAELRDTLLPKLMSGELKVNEIEK